MVSKYEILAAQIFVGGSILIGLCSPADSVASAWLCFGVVVIVFRLLILEGEK